MYYRLYRDNVAFPARVALQPNHSNLAFVDVNLISPPYTVANIVRYILEYEHIVDPRGRTVVYVDRRDANPAAPGTIIDIYGGPSLAPIDAIRIVLPTAIVTPTPSPPPSPIIPPTRPDVIDPMWVITAKESKSSCTPSLSFRVYLSVPARRQQRVRCWPNQRSSRANPVGLQGHERTVYFPRRNSRGQVLYRRT